jgi:hypothetical protein
MRFRRPERSIYILEGAGAKDVGAEYPAGGGHALLTHLRSLREDETFDHVEMDTI